MTVKELIQLLESQDQDATVVIATDHGDYWHSIAAGQVETVEQVTVQPNSYPCPAKVVGEFDGDDAAYRAVAIAAVSLEI